MDREQSVSLWEGVLVASGVPFRGPWGLADLVWCALPPPLRGSRGVAVTYAAESPVVTEGALGASCSRPCTLPSFPLGCHPLSSHAVTDLARVPAVCDEWMCLASSLQMALPLSPHSLFLAVLGSRLAYNFHGYLLVCSTWTPQQSRK